MEDPSSLGRNVVIASALLLVFLAAVSVSFCSDAGKITYKPRVSNLPANPRALPAGARRARERRKDEIDVACSR